MGCVYEYKGRRFNSIEEFDDFILHRGKFESKYGDAVFSTVIPMGVFDKLTKKASDGFKIFSIKQNAVRKRSGIVIEDDPYNASDYDYVKPFIGVTTAIPKMIGFDGGHFSMEFMLENYFNKLKVDAAKGNFDKSKGSNFSEDDVRSIFGVNQNGQPNTTEAIPESEFNDRVRKVLEAKWKFQADVGNAIHDTLQAYFVGLGAEKGKRKPIRYIRDKELRRSELKRIIRGVDGKGVYFTSAYFDNNDNNVLKSQPVEAVSLDLLSDEDIDNLFDVAESAYEKIKQQHGVDENGKEQFELFAEFPIFDDQEIDMQDYGSDEVYKRKLSGSIDLMVVDKNGIPHILDWKTSTKTYDNFGEIKRRNYGYQLGLYRQMLNRAGVNTEGGRMYIAPVRLRGIHQTAEGKWAIDGIIHDPYSDSLKDITGNVENDSRVMENISYLLKGNTTFQPRNEDFVQAATNEIKTILPEYDYSYENVSDEYVHTQFKKYCAIDKADGKWKYYRNPEHKGQPREIGGSYVVAESQEEMYEKIKQYRISKPQRRKDMVSNIHSSLVQKLNRNNPDADVNLHGNAKLYFDKVMAKYSNGRWEVVEDITDITKEFGVIVLRNKYSRSSDNGGGRIDIINITNESLNDMHPMKKGSELLSGYIHNDIIEKSKKSRMLTSIEGNIELMRTMSVINNLQGAFDANSTYIGNMLVINPNDGESIHASNEDIKYSYTTLMNANKNNGAKINRTINFGDSFEIIKDDMFEIQKRFNEEAEDYYSRPAGKRGDRPNLLSKFNGMVVYDMNDKQSLSSNLELQVKTKGAMRNALIQVQRQLEGKFKFLNEISSNSDIDSSNHDIYEMYIDISKAISELSGVPVKQQLFESNPWMQFEITKLLKKGYTSTSIDNPGMLFSDLLNSTTGYVGDAYQNIRDRIAGPLAKFTEIEERMIEALGYSNISMTMKSREDIWKEFYRTNADGTIDESYLFKTPSEIADPVKRQILDDLLLEINRSRLMTDQGYPSDELVRNTSNSLTYYYVPIMRKGWVDTNGTVHGTGDTLLTKLKNAMPDIVSGRIFVNARDQIKDTWKSWFAPAVEESTKAKKESNDLFKINENMLGEGDLEDRQKKIAEIGIDNISTNAVNAGATLAFSKISNNELGNALTLMKCSILSLKYEGDLMNRKYDKDIKYMQDYIKKNIKNEDLNDPKLKSLSTLIDKLSNIAVTAVLGFSPIQLVYQPMQGLFNNTALVTKRVLGDKSFGFPEFAQGMKISYGDILSPKRSKLDILNQIFGINDMDMNDYINKANDHKDMVSTAGWRKLAMVFASRPDYYNRMSIFTAQMIKDGTWDAYEKVGNRLVYDFKKDKRFSKLTDPNATKDAEYYKQLGEYTAIAKRMVVEGARNENGELFQYVEGEIVPLPKAYSNQQSEAYKNIADDVYGYYSHEKKALIHAMLVGKLFMQFKTYFSGKKNQYFLPGGVRLRGEYKHLTDDNGHLIYSYTDTDGIESYCVLNEDGRYINPTTDAEVSHERVVPFYGWKGQYQEGVLVTIFNILSEAMNNKISLKNASKIYTENADEGVRNAYRTNMRQVQSDLLISLLIGALLAGLLREMYNDIKTDDDVPSIAKDAAYILSRAVSNAALDANIVKTILSTSTDWNPLTFEWSKRAATNAYGVLSGDKNAFDAISNSFSSIGQVKNTFSSIWSEAKE